MDPNANKEQYLGLKVMRLLKPSLFSSLPFYRGNENSSNAFDKVLLEQAYHVKESTDVNLDTNFALSDFLILPQSFGNIFIGEVFSSYICVHNHTLVSVRQLSVKVELQTKTQKIALALISKHGDYIEEFQHDQTYDAIIHHAVKELGVHVLICNVNYTTEKDEKMGFKKFFKFLVSKPFEIQPRFPNFEKTNMVLFEAQIQNVTNSILFMEKVFLDPSEGIKVEDLNFTNKQGTKSIFGDINYMKPNEIKQYLFRITSSDASKPLPKPLTIGKLDIVWRNPFSDIGRLQTNPLTQQADAAVASVKKDIEVKVVEEPDLCLLEQVVQFDIEIKNISERVLELELNLETDDKFGYFWNGAIRHKLGRIEMNESKVVTVYLIPLKSGLLEVSGITITDIFLERVHDFTNLFKIFVL